MYYGPAGLFSPSQVSLLGWGSDEVLWRQKVRGQEVCASSFQEMTASSSCQNSLFLALFSSQARPHSTASTTLSLAKLSKVTGFLGGSRNTLVRSLGSWLDLEYNAWRFKGGNFPLTPVPWLWGELMPSSLRVWPKDVKCVTDCKYMKNWSRALSLARSLAHAHAQTRTPKCCKGVTSPNETSSSLLLGNCNEA